MTVALPVESLRKLVPLLASDHDGEVVNAARAIGRALKAAKCDWHDLTRSMTEVREKIVVKTEVVYRDVYRERPAPQPVRPKEESDAEQRNAVLRMAPKLIESGKLSAEQHNFVTRIYHQAMNYREPFSLKNADRSRFINMFSKYL